MRYIVSIFGFLLFTTGIISQNLTDFTKNHRWNNAFYGTDILVDSIRNSFDWDIRTNNLLDNQWRNLIDSNAYTNVKAVITSKAYDSDPNQLIQLELNRPLRLGGFDFEFDRISNPGWSQNSFVRANRLAARYFRPISDNYSITLNGSVSNRSMDLNGGLIDSSYTFESQRTAGAITVFPLGSLNGYSVLSKSNVTFLQSIKIKGDSVWSVTLENPIYFCRSKYTYSDSRSDNAYFNKFTLTESAWKDSLLQTNLGSKIQISIKYYDVVNDSDFIDTNQTFNLFVGAEYFNRWYVNNGSVWQINAINPFVDFKYVVRKLSVLTVNYYALNGFTQGSYKSLSGIQYKVGNRHQNLVSLYSNLEISRELPSIQYFRYQSFLISNLYEPEFCSTKDLSGGIGFEKNRIGLKMEVGYRTVNNLSVMDIIAVVSQIDYSALDFKLNLKYIGKVISIEDKLNYQHVITNSAFSLPAIVNRSKFDVRFPLFKKAIYLNSGIEGFYYSSYYAMGLHPGLGTNYIQNSHSYGDYLRSDVYLNAKIQIVDVELRLANWNYDWFGQKELVAPNYPGIPRFFQIMVNWKFKN